MAQSTISRSLELEQIEYLRRADKHPVGLELTLINEEEAKHYQQKLYQVRRKYDFGHLVLRRIDNKIWITKKEEAAA